MFAGVGLFFSSSTRRTDVVTERKAGQNINGRYQLQEQLGSGGMAVVWKAHDSHTDRLVAVKLFKAHEELLPTSLEYQMLMKRFEREAQQHKNVSHPHIVHFLEYAIDESSVPFIVMEYVVGNTLAKELKDAQDVKSKRHPYHAQLYPIMKQIINAMSYLHERGIVHRDLKPQNIMVSWESGLPYVRLLDFGIALNTRMGDERLTCTGGIVGTPWYMAPEMIATHVQDPAHGALQVGPQSDVFALATILYEAVTGRVSFKLTKDTPNEGILVAVEIANLNKPSPDPADLVPELNPILRSLIVRGMKKKPSERITSMKEFLTLLERAEEHEQRHKATSTPPPASKRSAPPSQRPQSVRSVSKTAATQAAFPAVSRPPPPPPRPPTSPLTVVPPPDAEPVPVPVMPPASRAPVDRIPMRSNRTMFVVGGLALGIGIALAISISKRHAVTLEDAALVAQIDPVATSATVPVPLPIKTALQRPPDAPQAAPTSSVLSVDTVADQLLQEGLDLQRQGKHRAALEKLYAAMQQRPNDLAITEAAQKSAASLNIKGAKALALMVEQLKAKQAARE
jgi:serine/threonine protein kinase